MDLIAVGRRRCRSERRRLCGDGWRADFYFGGGDVLMATTVDRRSADGLVALRRNCNIYAAAK